VSIHTTHFIRMSVKCDGCKAKYVHPTEYLDLNQAQEEIMAIITKLGWTMTLNYTEACLCPVCTKLMRILRAIRKEEQR